MLHNLKTVKNLVSATGEAKRILSAFRPDVVVGTGGYVCYPVLRAAARMGIPTAVHESNAVPGLTTKLLAEKADCVMLGFPGVEAAYKKSRRVVYTGTPVRGAFLRHTKAEARAKLGLSPDKPLVVSFWGSLGAARMNAAMRDFIPMAYSAQGFFHIHATGGGEAGLAAMREALAAAGISDPAAHGIDVRAFIYDMPPVLAAADLVLCRAGASTLAELTALGKPAVLVPSPYVTGNHQEENAVALERGGGAVMLRESAATGQALYDTVSGLLADAGRLSAMAASMGEMGNPHAAEQITELILDIMKK